MSTYLTHKTFTVAHPIVIRLVAGQSVAVPPFCAITMIQEQNVGATFDRRNFSHPKHHECLYWPGHRKI